MLFSDFLCAITISWNLRVIIEKENNNLLDQFIWISPIINSNISFM